MKEEDFGTLQLHNKQNKIAIKLNDVNKKIKSKEMKNEKTTFSRNNPYIKTLYIFTKLLTANRNAPTPPSLFQKSYKYQINLL